MSSLAGKTGLIVGIANKRSISWAIAQAAAAAGARLALTYPSERLEENVRELAATLENPLVLPCDVTSDEQIAALAGALDREFGGLDFLVHGAAFAPKDELNNPFVQTSRESFRVALDVSAYSLIGLTHAVAPLMEKRGGGSVLTLTYLGSQRVFTNYNVMGVAKAALEASVRYLASDLGPKNIRVNAISAGAIKTLAAAGISGFSGMLQVYRERAPLRRNVELGEVADAAVFLLEPGGARHHRRSADGRRRLPHHGRSLGRGLQWRSRVRAPRTTADSRPRSSTSVIRALDPRATPSCSVLVVSSSVSRACGPQTKHSVAGSCTSGCSSTRPIRPAAAFHVAAGARDRLSQLDLAAARQRAQFVLVGKFFRCAHAVEEADVAMREARARVAASPAAARCRCRRR